MFVCTCTAVCVGVLCAHDGLLVCSVSEHVWCVLFQGGGGGGDCSAVFNYWHLSCVHVCVCVCLRVRTPYVPVCVIPGSVLLGSIQLLSCSNWCGCVRCMRVTWVGPTHKHTNVSTDGALGHSCIPVQRDGDGDGYTRVEGARGMGVAWLESQTDKLVNEPVIWEVMVFEVDAYNLEPCGM